MKPRYVVGTVLGATLLIFIGAGCRHELPPSRPSRASGPDHTWTGIPTAYTTTASITRGTVRFVMDWGDLVDTTDVSYASGETATITHVWTSHGTMSVKVQAINSAAPEKASLWSWPESVDVILNSLPVIDSVEAPPLVMRGVEVGFTVRASDPDGDSIEVHIDWGDGKDTTSDFLVGPYYFGFYPNHIFAQVETARVVIIAQDRKGATSLPETAFVRVDTTGGVIWSYAAPRASPLMVNDGVEDVIYMGFLSQMPDPGGDWLVALTKDGGPKYTIRGDSSPSAGVAYCAASQHIVGGGVGLWALDRQLRIAWHLATPESSGWSDPAVSGDRMYFGNDDTLYCFVDSIDHGVRVATFPTNAGIVDAPVIDAQGNVYFGTDSGFLYKVGPGLDTTFWRSRLVAGKIHGPIVGSDGTIYCASESQCIYAVDPATGTPLWTVTLQGQSLRPALGQAAIFVGTSAGQAYSINPATGGVNWVRRLGVGAGISTAPVVAADGYVYFLNDQDVLYRVSQADGAVAWECDCASYLGGYGEVLYPTKPTYAYPSNSTILTNGNIIVAGRNALYCVAGNHAGPLDHLAPWPKWQHDAYNTGCAGGGR